MNSKSRFTLLLFFVFAFTSSFSQSLKIKKGDILLDGKAVAKISHEKNGPYTYSTTDGKPVFSITFNNVVRDGVTAPESWVEISSPDGRTYEFARPEKEHLVLSYQKIYTYVLMDCTPRLLGKNGLKISTIEELLNKNERKFSSRWDSIYSVLDKQYKASEEFAKANHLQIEADGTILIDKKQVGHIYMKMTNTVNELKREYTVYDMAKNKIAEMTVYSMNSCPDFSKILTYDGKVFYTKACGTSQQLSSDMAAKQFVSRIMTYGYPLGDMTEIIRNREAEKKKEKDKALAEKEHKELTEAMKNSVNIYNAPAEVIFTDGGHDRGNITLLYESIEEKMGKPKSGIIDLDVSYGSSAKMKNQSGDSYKLRAKDHVLIILKDKKFIGTKGIGDSGLSYLKAGDALLGVTKPAQFFEIVYDDGHQNYILQHPLEPNEWYIKLNGKEEAIYLGKKGILTDRSAKKIAASLTKYLNCPSMNADSYDTLSIEGLKQILHDYSQNCGK